MEATKNDNMIGGKIPLEAVIKAMQEEIQNTGHKVKIGFSHWKPSKGITDLFSRLTREPSAKEATVYIPSRIFGCVAPHAEVYPYGDEKNYGLYVQELSRHFKKDHCTKFFQNVGKRLGVKTEVEYSPIKPDGSAIVHFYCN